MTTRSTPAAAKSSTRAGLKGLPDPVGADLKATLRTLKLGRMLDTLPERLTLARQQNLPHADFLELVLADEVSRRDTNSAALRARAAGLDPGMRLDTWDTTAAVHFDQQLWNELTTLRFLDAPHGGLLLGPVGVGKTHLATAGTYRRAPSRRRAHNPRRQAVQTGHADDRASRARVRPQSRIGLRCGTRKPDRSGGTLGRAPCLVAGSR